MKMNLCFVIDTLGSGGAERVISSLSNYFSQQGYFVTLIMLSGKKSDVYYEIDSKVNIKTISENDKQKEKRLNKIKKLRELFKTIKPQIVVSFLPHINIYSFIAMSGLNIIHVPSLRSDPRHDIKGFVRRFLRKMCFVKAKGCVFQTKEASNFFGKKVEKKSIIIPNPLPPQISFHNNSFFEEKIVSTGSFRSPKNKICLLKAFLLFLRKHPNYKLIMYGDGLLKDECIRFSKDNNIYEKIVFMGNSKNWIENSINYRMFVLSSDYEGMPNSLMEAMASGIPSISTNCPVGGPKQLIRDGENGLLVPINDPEKLCEAMSCLADSNELAIKLKRNNKNMVEEYSIMAIGKKWEHYLLSLLNK